MILHIVVVCWRPLDAARRLRQFPQLGPFSVLACCCVPPTLWRSRSIDTIRPQPRSIDRPDGLAGLASWCCWLRIMMFELVGYVPPHTTHERTHRIIRDPHPIIKYRDNSAASNKRTSWLQCGCGRRGDSGGSGGSSGANIGPASIRHIRIPPKARGARASGVVVTRVATTSAAVCYPRCCTPVVRRSTGRGSSRSRVAAVLPPAAHHRPAGFGAP